MAALIDHQLLGRAGLALDEEAYVCVVAGLGVTSNERVSSAWGETELVIWSPYNFRRMREELGNDPRMNTLLEYRDRWKEQVGKSTDKRVLVEAQGSGLEAPDLSAVVRLLNHPAVGSESVFVRKQAPEADLRWEWPLRIAAFTGDFETLKLKRLRSKSPSKSLTEVHTETREQARSEILAILGSARDALRRVLDLPYRVRAGHLLLFGAVDIPWPGLQHYVEALLAETQAGALSIIAVPSSNVVEAINSLVREVSHNIPYDLAMARAFPREASLNVFDLRLLNRAALTTVAKDLGRRVKRLPLETALVLPEEIPKRLHISRARMAATSDMGVMLEEHSDTRLFDRESHGASDLREIAVATRSARHAAARREEPRMLQGNLFLSRDAALVPESRGLIVGSRYRLDVFIGPPGIGAISADDIFQDDQLDWRNRDSYRLQVVFAEPRQWDEPLKGTIELPRGDKSPNCSFVFTPTRAGPFAGRVMLYYRGRVLQTALLRATVVDSETDLRQLGSREPLRFAVESVLRRSLETLDERRKFDACLVLNHTTAGTRAMTAAGKEGAHVASLDGVNSQLAEINRLLNQVALNTKKYGMGISHRNNAQLLGKLAAQGNILHRRLVLDYINRSSSAEALRTGKYLQIVSTQPDALVPLEFIYEYLPPQDGAPVCKNVKQALKDGYCPSSCVPKENPAPHVCPLGFWGLSKVIERHVHDPILGTAAVIQSEPIIGREELRLKGFALLAASEQVSTGDRSGLEKDMKLTWKDVVSVKTWKDWRSAVKSKKPVLLLALPHADGTGADISLEISGNVLKSIFIDGSYVRGDSAKPPPVALLLGCDTTNVAYTDAYARHVAVFRQADAALVLGTVATVLAADAAIVAGKIIKGLTNNVKKSPERFGEVLRQVKCEAVAESLMMAMCLVAFGDADWRLT